MLRRIVMTACLAAFSLAWAESVETIDHVAGSRFLENYLRSKEVADEITRLGVVNDRKLGLEWHCNGGEYDAEPMQVAPMEPVEMTKGAKYPQKGSWMIRYRVKRCGAIKVYNALFYARAGGFPPHAVPYYPGSTLASPALTQEVLPKAAAAAQFAAKNKRCGKATPFDMRVIDKPRLPRNRDETYSTPWSEIWEFRLCGERVDVPVRFTPNEGGGVRFVVGGG